jgi:hypothetical protein
MVRLFCVLVVTGCVINLHVGAQILRVDKNHLESDSAGYYSANADVTFSLDNRTISPQEQLIFTRLSSKADVLYVSRNHAYILINSIEYLSSSNATPFSTGYSHLRINFRRKHKVSYETYAQIQYDGVRRMRMRLLGGGGIRITPIDKDGFDIHFGTGLMYEVEKWNATEASNEPEITKKIPKLSTYVGMESLLSKLVKLNIWGQYQAGYDVEDQFYRNRYSAEVTVTFIINKKLSWNNRFSYYYDAQPVIAINPAYYQVSNGLRITL